MTSPAAWRRLLPAVVGVLLVVCAALVIIGGLIERGGQAHAGTGTVESSGHTETGEGAHAENGAGQQPAAAREGVLGVPIESPVALGVLGVVSVGLAALVWRRPTRLAAGAVVVFAVAAGVLDVAEVSRQFTADRVGLAVLAMVVALLRVATVAGGAVVWRAAPSRVATRAG